jgi:hypothetical protein
MSYETVDMKGIGQRTVGIIDQLVNRSTQARGEVDGGQIYDMHYKEFVDDPVAAVRRIYEHFGYNYGPTMDDNLRAYLHSNPQHRHGVHRYSLDSYCLDEETLRDQFASYCDRFGLEQE